MEGAECSSGGWRVLEYRVLSHGHQCGPTRLAQPSLCLVPLCTHARNVLTARRGTAKEAARGRTLDTQKPKQRVCAVAACVYV